MALDVADDTYYKITGGKIPVKWTAPEVSSYVCTVRTCIYIYIYTYIKLSDVQQEILAELLA